MRFADIHCHALFGADDGPKDEAGMLAILDAAYADGVRVLCLTPHSHLGYYGDNRIKVRDAYVRLRTIAESRYPHMHFLLGSELRYSKDCIAWLSSGMCRTMNGTKCVLVDFSEAETHANIVAGLQHLLNAGYIPILAHAERYGALEGKTDTLRQMRAAGVYIQLDTQSLFGGFGLRAKTRAKTLLKMRLIDFVASDAHDTTERPPQMSEAFEFISRKFSHDYAVAVCYKNALEMLKGAPVGKNMEINYGRNDN